MIPRETNPNCGETPPLSLFLRNPHLPAGMALRRAEGEPGSSSAPRCRIPGPSRALQPEPIPGSRHSCCGRLRSSPGDGPGCSAVSAPTAGRGNANRSSQREQLTPSPENRDVPGSGAAPRGCAETFSLFKICFYQCSFFPELMKKNPNSSRHCARARSRGSASLCPLPSPLSAGIGGSAGAPHPAASQHFCPRTRPDLLRSNLPCSIVRVPFAHDSPPRPSCSAFQHRLPGAERFCSVFPSLAVPRAEPGRGWAGGRSCPVSSSALPSAAQELPSPHPEQTEPGRPGQAGARAGFNHVKHRLWGAGADEGCGTQGRWAALLGCREGSRRREASIIKERDETKVHLRCHL